MGKEAFLKQRNYIENTVKFFVLYRERFYKTSFVDDRGKGSYSMTFAKKITTHYMWPIWRAYLVYVLIGYAIYFMARLSPIHPAWAIELIEMLKPLIGELNTAARVSDQAFQVQMLMIYVFFGSMRLVVYTGYCFLFNVDIHNGFVKMHIEHKTKRFKLLWGGLLGILFLPLYYVSLMTEAINISWRDQASFGPGIGAATYLLLISCFMPWMGILALKALMLAIFGLHLKPETTTQN